MSFRLRYSLPSDDDASDDKKEEEDADEEEDEGIASSIANVVEAKKGGKARQEDGQEEMEEQFYTELELYLKEGGKFKPSCFVVNCISVPHCFRCMNQKKREKLTVL